MKIRKRFSEKSLIISTNSRKRFIISKSPQSKISSPRIAYFRKEKHVKPATIALNQQPSPSIQQQILIFTQNNDTFNQILNFPLKRKLILYNKQTPVVKKEILIITKIQQFYEHYNKYSNSLIINYPSIQWIIISNAINNKQTQEEFNLEYQPITFLLLKNITEVVNHINFTGRHVKEKKLLVFFKKIINFGVYKNQYGVILEECLDQKIKSFEENAGIQSKTQPQLWILSKQQLLGLKNSHYNFYLLTETNINNRSLDLPISTTQKIIYILHQNYDYLLSLLQIKQLQQKITKKQLKQISYKSNNKQYHQKIIQKYFKGQIIYNLINFPEEISFKLKEMMGFNLVLKGMKIQNILREQNNIFNVYYQGKEEDDIFGYQFKKNQQNLQKQIDKINKYYESILELRGHYHQIRPFFNQYSIIFHNISQSKILSQQLLYFTKRNPYEIKTLQSLNNFFSQKLILISNPLNNKKSLINPKLNIHIIELNTKNQIDKINLHKKIINLISKLIKQQLLLNQKKQIKKILNFCPELIKIQKNIFFNFQLQNFKQILLNLNNNNKYIIILSMDQYNQEKQKFLKQLEFNKNIIFQVYLQYGNQFIFRGKNNKYNFYKKSQIIQKINNIKENTDFCGDHYYFRQSKDKKSSDITYNHHYQKKWTFSTPNLYNNDNDNYDKEILICLPKSVPIHSLVNRSSKSYTILIYNNPTQIKQLLHNLTSQYYAIIINTAQDFLNNPNKKQRYQFIKIKDLTQKILRQQIDKIIDKFNLIKKPNELKKKDKQLPAVVLYDQKNQKQLNSIQKFNNIFKTLKIIFMTKNQFKNIIKYYKIYDVCLYQMGKNQIQDKNIIKINNIIQLFKIQMSPCILYHQYNSQRSIFDIKNIFVKSYQQYIKSLKIKGNKTKSQINFYQQISKNKNIIQKQYTFTQSGIVILQSSDLNIFNKKQKFNHYTQLISLCVNNTQKGNQICILISQSIFSEIKYYINIYNRQFVWIIIVQDLKKCIIKEPNLIFIQKNQVQHTIFKVIQEYKQFKNKSLQLFHQKFIIQEKQDEIKLIFQCQKGDNENRLQIVWDKKYLQYSNKDLKHVFLLKNIKNLEKIIIFLKQYMRNAKVSQKILTNIKKMRIEGTIDKNNDNINYNKDDQQMTSQNENQANLHQQDTQKQKICIILKQCNKKFIEQTLTIIQQKYYALIIYEEIEELLSYNQLQKSFFIIEGNDNIHLKDCLIVQSNQTPLDFSHKLKNYINAIRQFS